MGDGEQGRVGEAFMRANAAHYHRVFFAGRLVVVTLSVLLGWLVWRWSRRLYGSAAALFSLALYALSPEALAHAGLATLDLATALGFTASIYCFWGFARTGRWSWWLAMAVAVGATFLTRFAAVLLVPMLLALALLGIILGRFRRPSRVWLGLALLPISTLLILVIGYRGGLSFSPLSTWPFESRLFQTLQRVAPALRLPLPDLYLGGFDRQLVESGPGVTKTYLFGQVRDDSPWYYFPVALAFKWPLAFLFALGLRVARSGPMFRSRRRIVDEMFLLLPAAGYLAVAMFLSHLSIGVRYVLPVLPFLCIWCGGWIPRSALRPERVGRRTFASGRVWNRIAIGLVLLLSVETATTAPWYLAFFNLAAGGPGGGDRLVNDSNVDWGQGLIGLRDELRRRGIHRIYLAYHGTTDPAIYGIDYVPYRGGRRGTESEWLAVSSYYLVGLSQRMMTQQGRTEFMRMELGPLRNAPPAARPAHNMYLFRLR